MTSSMREKPLSQQTNQASHHETGSKPGQISLAVLPHTLALPYETTPNDLSSQMEFNADPEISQHYCMQQTQVDINHIFTIFKVGVEGWTPAAEDKLHLSACQPEGIVLSAESWIELRAPRLGLRRSERSRNCSSPLSAPIGAGLPPAPNLLDLSPRFVGFAAPPALLCCLHPRLCRIKRVAAEKMKTSSI